MKTASVRDLRNRFSTIAAWIEKGEAVQIIRGGKIFAHLVPANPAPRKRFRMPGIAARLNKIFGEKTYSAADITEGLADSRGDMG